MYFFFFSSRRRHTRYWRDWSSDVCSSDLLNQKIEEFAYGKLNVTNFEMESSALAGLSKLMGHKALTCCMVIANRRVKEANTGYKNSIDGLIEKVLERI